jgi:3-oxoacyl-[acyl-carrier-protein] synthase-3
LIPTKGVRFAGTGSYLPERVVTNDDMSKTLDTNDEWIRTRTGISERRFAAPEQATSDLGIKAARRALDAAGVAPTDIDLIICATMTPDYVIPSTAALIQRAIGAERAGGFDLGSACSGFVLSVGAATGYIKTGAAKNVLVVGAEKMSVAMDMQDRTTAVIFADGAGAAVLQPADEGADGSNILALRQGLKGDVDVLSVPAGGSRRPASLETVQQREHYIKMAGRETFKFAVKTFSALIEDTCADAGITPADLKVIVPHQVNQRIIEAACDRSNIDMSRCVINIDRVGNTSAASVAIALDESVRAGRIERGDLLLLVAFGAGLSWASALIRW